MTAQDITTQPMYRRARLGIGYLPQEASFPRADGRAEILSVLEVTKPTRTRRQQMLDELLAEFCISHLRADRP